MNMNTEEILMVDDERAIRLAVRTALTRGRNACNRSS